MANKKRSRRRKFGLAGGPYSLRRKSENAHKFKSSIEKGKGKPGWKTNIEKYRNKVLRRVIFKKKNVLRNRQMFVSEHSENFIVNHVSCDSKSIKLKISKVSPLVTEGYRLFGIDMLQKHISTVTLHVVSCVGAKKLAERDISPVKIVSEFQTLGLATVLIAQCHGCDTQFKMESSCPIPNENSHHYDVNVRAVWGSMVTGGGSAHLNETMATFNAPGMSQRTFTKIEQEIGDMWGKVVEEDLIAAGAVERQIAIDKGNYHEGVPAITVICDGGWSKRSHKHSYNAMGGCAIIIGAETGKLLYIGVRNKYCYICNRAEATHTEPSPHRCFKNWKESSQSMESDIILEGFQKAESMHGLRFTKVIADGDSSVFAKLQEHVPVWGKSIEKIECANHICKCLRGSLEKLVDENPLYKGKNNIPKSVRIRLASAVRCAIRMRSRENGPTAVKKLEHDIRNSVHHIYGNHTRCSDFCKLRPSPNTGNINSSDSMDGMSDNSIPDVMQGVSQIWKDTTSEELQEESRFCSDTGIDLDTIMLRDISILLDRVASKSARLMGNQTTNLAESWMSIRAKFDGGKLYNRCNRGSWHSRCLGGSLRMNLGPQWSPKVWEKTTKSNAGHLFRKLYAQRENALISSKRSKIKPEVKARRLKRKYQDLKVSTTKKARMDYGPDAVDSVPDITAEELEAKKTAFVQKHINLTEDKIRFIENTTKKQSVSAVWIDERKKRVTASNFGSIVKRNVSIPVKKLVHQLLYSSFRGNTYTRRGLMEEAMTTKEYISCKDKDGVKVDVQNVGLIISRENKFLAASPDGKVIEKTENGNASVGLLEIKNLLHSKPMDLTQAAKEIKTFCLEINDKQLSLKKTHPYYFQVQGQLNVTKLPWADFVVRTLNPYQIHIERIYIDEVLWNHTMLPKLTAFYNNALLPELASPRNDTLTGIREPGVWYNPKKVDKRFGQQQQSTGAKKVLKTQDPIASTSCTCSSKDISRLGTQSVKKSAKKDHIPVTEQNLNRQPQSETPSTSSSQEICRPRRSTKVKFIGRRISHEWVIDESTNVKQWYTGTVVGVTKGKDGELSAEYEILYDGEDQVFVVDHLIEDFRSSSVKFIDI